MKYAPKYDCEKCNQTGIGKLEDYQDGYCDYLKQYKIDVEKYKTNLELYKSIKSKLTKEEWEFLEKL